MGKSNTVIVYGTNVGAQRVAANLGKMGYRVFIINPQTYLGESLSDLEIYRPRHICNLCLRFVIQKNPNVDIINNAKVVSISGNPGNFELIIRRTEPSIDMNKCILCDKCIDICPVSVTDIDHIGIPYIRKAIKQILRPVTKPPYFIDFNSCTKCGKCVDVCPTNAINIAPKTVEEKINAGAVILGPVPKQTDKDTLGKFGFGKSKNVITNTDFEYLFLGVGESAKYLRRLSDGKRPKRVAIISTPNFTKKEYASFLPDTISLEISKKIKELESSIDVIVFLSSLNIPGKGQLRLLREVKERNVKVILIDDIKGVPVKDDSIMLTYKISNKEYSDVFDMVILTTGIIPNDDWRDISEVFGLTLNEDGFVVTDQKLPFITEKEGIFAIGSFIEPKSAPESLIDGAAIVNYVVKYLGTPQPKLKSKSQYLPEIDVSEQDPNIGVFLCTCADQLTKTIDYDELEKLTSFIEGVSVVKRLPILCSKEGLETVTQIIKKHNLNRVIFAACTPNLISGKLQKALMNARLNPSLMDLLPIKEYVAWVHSDKEKATYKAYKLLDMLAEKVRYEQAWDIPVEEYSQNAVVIGGGIAGMQVALAIASRGYSVTIIEKRSSLGGYAEELTETIDGINMSSYADTLKELVSKHNNIRVITNARITDIAGYAGHYSLSVKRNNETEALSAGVIIISTGGTENLPQIPNLDSVMSLNKFDQLLYRKDKSILSKRKYLFVCGGAVNQKTLYSTSSKIACQQAIKNALKLKEIKPDAEITILYSDSISYGTLVKFYHHAEENGITFVEFDPLREPKFSFSNDEVLVEFYEPNFNTKMIARADLVAVSKGVQPRTNENKILSKLLDIKLDPDGFFEVADDPYSLISIKMRPHDLATNGIFVCGLARSPQTFKETILQSEATAASAMFILQKRNMSPATGRLISYVVERKCAGCGLCVDVCGYNARIIDLEKKVAVVLPSLCEGCGACTAACPSGAAKLRMYSDTQMISLIDKAFLD